MSELREGISILKLTGPQANEVTLFLGTKGFKLYSNRSTNAPFCIRTMKRIGVLYYVINNSDKISQYIDKGINPYRADDVYEFSDFYSKFMSGINNIPEVKTTSKPFSSGFKGHIVDGVGNKKIGCVAEPKYPPMPNYEELFEPPLQISKSKVLEAYKATTSIDVRQLLKILFGKELFDEKYYKIGNKFKYSGISGDKEYKLIKVNLSVVTIIDEDGENFCNSKTVKDPYKITESELKNLLGIYFDKFTLI